MYENRNEKVCPISGSGTTVKGRLEGVKLENGIAGGTYHLAKNRFDGTSRQVISWTGTFEIQLKDPQAYSTVTLNEGSEYEVTASSPVALRYNEDGFDDYYLFQDEWEGEIASWFMSSEDDLF